MRNTIFGRHVESYCPPSLQPRPSRTHFSSRPQHVFEWGIVVIIYQKFHQRYHIFFNVINGHHIDIRNKLLFFKDRNTGYGLRENETQDFFPNFSRANGFEYRFFNRIVNEQNSLLNGIAESNNIKTFKRNVLTFIKDNQNIYLYICLNFSYTLISGDISRMVNFRFWFSLFPQLFFISYL